MTPHLVISVVCPVCKKSVQNMELLTVHMKNVHEKTDHNRINRLTETFMSELNKDSEGKKSNVLKKNIGLQWMWIIIWN